ncbi:hypothetical protein [Scytonema sp. NUACC26]|uniref:hypothetical protein n=1 Tax=Scytonema sp. NUACC26 TaxID=3140176 RepID=UPI0038B35C94
MTIRVPKIIAAQVMEIAHRLDSGEKIDFDTNSKSEINELVTESIADSESSPKGDRQAIVPSAEFRDEKITESIQGFKSESKPITNSRSSNLDTFENVTKSNLPKTELGNELVTESNPPNFENVTKSSKSVNEAIELAKKMLKHKKSARHTVAKLISKLYSTSVSFEDLK